MPWWRGDRRERGCLSCGNTRKEGAGARVDGMGEDLLAGPFLNHLAAFHENHPVGDLTGEPHLVGDHDHGQAVVRELIHDGEHLVDEFGIECAGGFVEQHDLRIDARALAMATRCCWPPES